MGFSESFATLAMDRNEQERYERLKNSSNPEDRAEAKKMIGDNSNDLIQCFNNVSFVSEYWNTIPFSCS